jgi:hypothetical protein
VSSIIMRITESASLKAHQSGLPIEPLATAQIAVAALVGTGVKSLEAAVRWNIPFFISDRPYPALPMEQKFPLDAIFDRSRQMVVRAHGRGKASMESEPLSDVELEIKATALGSIVVEEVKAAGLSVYTQKLLFAPEFREMGREVLKGLVFRGMEVPFASVAIASGMIPPLPSNSTKEHLFFLGPEATRGRNSPTFAQWVAMGDTLLVEFPLPDIEPGDRARYDNFNAIGSGTLHPKRVSADLGLGFFVVRQERLNSTSRKPEGSPYFHVMTPSLHFRGGENKPSFRPEFQAKTVHEHHRDDSYQKFEKQLRGKGRTFIAKLKVCPGCEEIYSDARADLKKRCDCVTT